jgi:hypothetical protein
MLTPVSAGRRIVQAVVDLCDNEAMASAPCCETQARIARRVRRELPFLISDESPREAGDFALYTLADPRDVRGVRYVGQTRAPRRRYLQHVRSARLWLAAERPWWIRVPRLCTLYVWIRELYTDEQRLPFMLVSEWLASEAEARARERRLISELAARGLPLLNVEAQRLRQRQPRTAATPAAAR